MFVVLCLLLFVVFMLFFVACGASIFQAASHEALTPPSGAPRGLLVHRPTSFDWLLLVVILVVVVVGAGFKLSQSDCGFA